MTNDTQKLLALELFDSLLGSWWTVVAGLCLGASAALVALHYTPRIYEATALIEADVDKLPEEFVRRTVSDDPEPQLGNLRSAVLSPDNLSVVIKEAFEEPPDEAALQALSTEIGSGVTLEYSRNDRTISVRYRDEEPQRTAIVANALAEFFVTENQLLRAESAREVRKSIESLTSDASVELQQVKQELSRLLAAHPHELETQRFANEQMITQLEKNLEENESALKTVVGQLGVLEALRRNAQSTPARGESKAPGRGSAESARILELEQEIRQLLTRFTENHPEVLSKRREIERLQATLSDTVEAPAQEEPAPAAPSEIDTWATRIHALKTNQAWLQAKGDEIRKDLVRYRGYLASTPIVQQQVEELRERISVLQRDYLDSQAKIERAKVGEQLEAQEFGNPFAVSRYAVPPSTPVTPDPRLFLGAGVAGGLLLFVGPLLARVILAPKVLSETSLLALSQVPVLVTIPVIPTPDTNRQSKLARARNFGLSGLAVSILCTVFVVQRFVLG